MSLFSVVNGVLIVCMVFYAGNSMVQSEHHNSGLFYFSGMVFFLDSGLLITNLMVLTMGVYEHYGVWIGVLALVFNVALPFLYMCFLFAKNVN